MRYLKEISKSRPGRAMTPLIVILMLSACVSRQMIDFTLPPLEATGAGPQVEDVDVLAVSPAMEDFLRRYILKYSDRNTRLTLLMNAATGNGVLGFTYDETYTLTSTEAFDRRTGNCLGFANMMIALARRVGLKAEYQEVFRQPQWTSRADTVLLIKHVNVVIRSPSYAYVLDVSGINPTQNTSRRIIGDAYAKALYFNNIGAQALIQNDLPTAYAYMAKAVKTEPRLTDAWVNLGVLFSRNDQLDEAALVLERAMKIDPTEYAALGNLYEVYIAREDLEAARKLEGRVERYRRNNPYYLLQLSEEALRQDEFRESAKLLQRALRKKKNDHQFHFAMAKTWYLSGDTEAAENSLQRARELAPENMKVHYDRPLNELVAEAQARAREKDEAEVQSGNR